MQQPLVSIVVITYNSEEFVLETLESAKNQSYRNIELIISDDGSVDKTVDICKSWLYENQDRFKSTKLLTVEENTGIPANCNRGVKVSSGDWIKLIAGDDVLVDDAIEKVINKIALEEEMLVIQTIGTSYKDTFDEKNKMEIWKPSKYDFFGKSAETQYQFLKYGNFLHAPSVFFKRSVFDSLFFDEQFKKVEDYPFWIILTKNGVKISFIDINTVKYRVHINSVQNLYDKQLSAKGVRLINSFKSKYYKNYKYSFPNALSYFYIFMDKVGLNNGSSSSSIIYHLLKKFQNMVKFLILKTLIKGK